MPDKIRPHYPLEVRAQPHEPEFPADAIAASDEDPSAARAHPGGDGRCVAVTDDDERCRRAPHPDSPNDHVFGRLPTNPVDGGRRWSDWIKIVHALQVALIGYELKLSSTDAQKLMQLAQLLELHTIKSNKSGFIIFSDDPTTTWRTYKSEEK